MFKLNGDIIRQLNSIYAFSFNRKYKKELKEKILFFLNYKLQNYMTSNIQETLASINKIVLIENNQIVSIYMSFIDDNQDELLTYFSPIWYNQNSNIKIRYLKEEKDYIFKKFNYEQYLILEKKFLFNKFTFSNPDYFLIGKNFSLKLIKINYSKELYIYFRNRNSEEILDYLKSYNNYFLQGISEYKLFFSYLENFFDNLNKFDNEDKRNLLLKLTPFFVDAYKIKINQDLYLYRNVFPVLIRLYYLLKIQKNIKLYID